MKKFFSVMAICLAVAMVASTAFAYQEAFDIAGHRTQSRNAANGTIDAAYYNPAGLVAMQDGLYIDLGNRVLGLTTKSELVGLAQLGKLAAGKGTKVESSTITWLLPNAALVYKQGNGAVFYTFDIREGGAGGTWDKAESISVLTDQTIAAATLGFKKIEASTYTLGHTLGASAKLNDMLTISGGLRYLTKYSTLKYDLLAAKATFLANGYQDEYKFSWVGYTGFFGVMLTPVKELNVAIQYQGRTMKLANSVDFKHPIDPDVEQDTESLSPSILLVGVGYKLTPELEVMLSYNREFTKGKLVAGNYALGNELNYYDRYNTDKQVFGLGVEYKVNQALLVSAGVSYKLTETNEKNNTDPTNPGFNEYDLGAGLKYAVMPNLDVQFGAAYNIYEESKGKSNAIIPGTWVDIIKHNRSAWVVGLGVTYKAM